MGLIEMVAPCVCFGSAVAAFAVFFYKISRLDAAKERELEEMQQEIERLRARMDEQYSDLTLMLNQEREERERDRRV